MMLLLWSVKPSKIKLLFKDKLLKKNKNKYKIQNNNHFLEEIKRMN